ncbi:PREDICTED: phosphate-regulating neutral endopeptidase [Atta cephalotes]|uniref:Peptidase M13 N-terminal domain-containing protein n=1 Tax=Atta cephalotes TaxID=12957 RepID=A0A158P0I7_ATTCE|nr:PREDICTED: phosphate-regulating neutral endopeptidase [Atta cephalotes]
MNNERKNEDSVYSVGSQNHLVPIRSRKTFFKKKSQISNFILHVISKIKLYIYYAKYSLGLLTFLKPQLIQSEHACKNMMKICDSEDCVRIAASLKESMNESVDPCDDFYQYACGRWPQEHPIPDSSLTNSWFSERSNRMYRKIRDLLTVNMSASEIPWAVMQAKILFTSCMDVYTVNELDLSPIFDLLKLLNLPMIPFITNKTTNYVEQLASIKKILDLDIFFGFEVIPDPKNKTKNVLYLHLPIRSNPFLTDKELEKRLQIIRSRLRKLEELDDEVVLSENEDAELTYMVDVIKYIINNGTDNKCTSDNESIFEDEVLKEFVKGIYNISNLFYDTARADQNQSISVENLSDSDYMLVDDLQKLTDDYVIDSNLSFTLTPIWRPFIESIFEGIDKLDLDNKDKILIGNLEYLKDVALLLACFEEEALESYIWWTVVDIVVPHASEKLRDIWNKYVSKVTDVEVVGESKSLFCGSVVNKLMGMAVSWLFVDPTFHENKVNKVQEMLEDIREAFGSLVAKTDWMDQSTKTATLKKSQKMEYEIGFPTWLFNEKKLNEYYEGIDLSEIRYLANMIQIVQVQLNNTWISLHDENIFNESYWATDPTDVNAFHTFQLNHITIPAGILQFPFYELGLEALNYGAIGAIFGHELTHGFDPNGRFYDGDGNYRQWWTNESILEYSDRTKCFIDHYNTYYEVEVNDYIDGELTLGENIADNGGLREAVVAYKRWKTRHSYESLLPGLTQFTHEQLLFLSFAHLWCESYTAISLRWMMRGTHCPGHVRLQAVLRNSKEFSTAWNCPAGSTMNPLKKCRLW